MYSHNHSGFTLVELSIVLVIIGLIVGGVLVGRDLIQSAKLRSVLSDIEKFNSATLTFENKYNCLPGDCPNATDFFGTFASCNVWSNFQGMDNSTCNGNVNDGKILFASYGEEAPPGQYNYWFFDETFLFWQHLSLAGLIKGKYAGGAISTGSAKPGINVPTSQLEKGCYSVSYSFVGARTDAFPVYAMNANIFAIGNQVVDNDGAELFSCVGGLYSLPAIAAQNLDSKIDDGKPYIGNVVTLQDLYGGNWNNASNIPPIQTGCTNIGGVVTPLTAVYAASAPASACSLFFKAAF